MNRTAPPVDSEASHSGPWPTVGAIADSYPPAVNRKAMYLCEAAGRVPTSVRLYPGGGLSRLPLVTDIRRVMEAGASWEHPTVHSDTHGRLCLVARISILRGDAADDPEWPAMRCARHFIF